MHTPKIPPVIAITLTMFWYNADVRMITLKGIIVYAIEYLLNPFYGILSGSNIFMRLF